MTWMWALNTPWGAFSISYRDAACAFAAVFVLNALLRETEGRKE